MEWDKEYDICHIPAEGDIGKYLGEAEEIWKQLTNNIEETYKVKPQVAFSKCLSWGQRKKTMIYFT